MLKRPGQGLTSCDLQVQRQRTRTSEGDARREMRKRPADPGTGQQTKDDVARDGKLEMIWRLEGHGTGVIGL